jgi:hypothetical protein
LKDTIESNAYAATEVSRALDETCLDSTYGALPTLAQYDSEEADRVFDDGDLDGVPGVLDAYLDHHQRQWL